MITGKKGLTIKKKVLPGITASTYEDFVFAHQANAGETQITFSNLTTPSEMSINGFVNPDTTTILNRKLSNKSNNIEVVSSINGLLIQNMTYKVYDAYINFIGYTSAANEVFVVTSRSSASSEVSSSEGTSSGISYKEITSDQTAVSGTGYIMNKTVDGSLELILPSTSVVGSIIEVVGKSANGWLIKSNPSATSQYIVNKGTNSQSSSNNIIPLLKELDAQACVRLVCTVANSEWTVVRSNGVIGFASNYYGDGTDGDVTISSNTNFSNTTDGDMVVKHYNTLTINSGVTVTTNTRCKGLVLYVKGNCTINGTLSMTGKGALVNPSSAGVPTTGIRIIRECPVGNDYLANSDVTGCGAAIITSEAKQGLIRGEGKIFTIDREGAAGGASQSLTYPPTGGTVGDTGKSAISKTGGGGSGRAWREANGSGTATSGAGAAGTCFSGGSGGGGADSHLTSSATAGPGIANGGAGGYAAGAGYNAHGSGGGAGNPGGAPAHVGTAGQTGTGGVLILIVGGNLTIGGAGKIEANGMKGGDGGSNNVVGPGRSTGGGSGGGVCIVLHKGTLTNSGSITANGGTGGILEPPPTDNVGGAGSLQIAQIW